MKGMQWVVGAVALVVFDAALIYGVRYWQAHRVSTDDAPVQVADAPVQAPVSVASPASFPLKTACVNGSLYAYRPEMQRWDKTPFECDKDGHVTRCIPEGNICK